MSYKSRTVTVYGTESKFLYEYFTNLITDSEGHIEFTGYKLYSSDFQPIGQTELSQNYFQTLLNNSNNVTNNLTFYINIYPFLQDRNIYYTCRFQRQTSQNAYYYNLYFPITCYGSTNDTISYLSLSGGTPSGYGVNIITNRTWKYIIFSNDKYFFIRFGACDAIFSSSFYTKDLLIIKQGALLVAAGVTPNYSNSYNLKDLTFYDYNNTNNTYKLIDRLPYYATTPLQEVTQIDVLANKMLINNLTENLKITSLSALQDCSTITRRIFFEANNKKYYSIDQNTIIEYDNVNNS